MIACHSFIFFCKIDLIFFICIFICSFVLVCLFLTEAREFFVYLWNRSFLLYMCCEYLFPLGDLHFNFLNGSFYRLTLLMLRMSNSSAFSFMVNFFYLKMSLTILRLQRLYSVFSYIYFMSLSFTIKLMSFWSKILHMIKGKDQCLLFPQWLASDSARSVEKSFFSPLNWLSHSVKTWHKCVFLDSIPIHWYICLFLGHSQSILIMIALF